MGVSAAITNQIKKKRREQESQQRVTESTTQETLEHQPRT
jgi:hypothetical protein